MPIHREVLVRVLDDDHPAGILGPGEDDIAVGDCVDLRAGGLALERVPVLSRVPIARVVPGVLGGVAVANAKAIARELARPADQV